MIEKELESLRKDYIKTEPTNYLIHDGWRDLSLKLDSKQSRVFPKAFALIALIIFLSSAVVASAQAAKPGQALYPVKILSENVYAQVTGSQQFKIERRAQEVIDLSGKSSDNLDVATQEYQKTLGETKPQNGSEEERQKFTEALEKQEEKFKKAIEKNPQSQEKLQEVIKETEKAKGQVQGQKDEKEPRQNNDHGNQGQSNQKQNPSKNK